MTAVILSQTKCALGEGPMWHPERKTIFWFDIMSKKLFEKSLEENHVEKTWDLDEFASAAGWVDRDTLLIATSSGLYKFDLQTGNKTLVVEIEANNDKTRSSDGRADPYGGFWIGTAGLKMEAGAGSLYRYYKGELRQLFDGITMYNATCFSPDKKTAYFCDTFTHTIEMVTLDEEGWPVPESRRPFADLSDEKLLPDGAVVDSEGNLWTAQFSAARVACYSGKDGSFMREVKLPTNQTTCPAFGGESLQDIFVTTSTYEADDDENAGKTYIVKGGVGVKGQPEYRVTVKV